MRGREYVISIKPCGRGMLMETLRYADEVNRASGFFREIGDAKPDDELLDLAETLIAKKSAPFDPAKFHDHYVEALKELVARKLKAKGGKVTPEPEDTKARSGSNVIDLMAALKQSLEKKGDAAPAGKTAAKAPSEKAPARRAQPKPAAKKPAARAKA